MAILNVRRLLQVGGTRRVLLHSRGTRPLSPQSSNTLKESRSERLPHISSSHLTYMRTMKGERASRLWIASIRAS